MTRQGLVDENGCWLCLGGGWLAEAGCPECHGPRPIEAETRAGTLRCEVCDGEGETLPDVDCAYCNGRGYF